MINQARVARLQEVARREGLAGFVVVPGASLVYLSGFRMGMSERPAFLLVPAEGEAAFFCPAFEAERVRRGTGIDNLLTYTDEAGPQAALTAGLRGGNWGGRIAFEYRACRLLEYDLVAQAVGGCQPVDARPLLAELRMAKDEAELAAIQRAADAVNVMLDAIRERLEERPTELELQSAAIAALRQHYPEAGVAFITVVSGERTALPHASASERRVEPGDLVLADLGASIDGYVSDITRTFATGDLDEEMNRIYDLVLQANAAGCEAARAGMTAGAVDAVTRQVIVDGGYGEYFTHRTGHGIGLEVHEEPYIVSGNEQILQPGHTFTIEPGIYLPGKGGVRIEDNVVITAAGARTLTSYPRDLRQS